MTDMVRKHTVEGSANWKTISDVVSRSKEMLAQAKSVSRNFVRTHGACLLGFLKVNTRQVPPAGLFESTPIGSSSASMYPGYSPADHEYGRAAQELGEAVGKARAVGLEVKIPEDGPEYEIGQSKSAFRGNLAKIRAAKVERGLPILPDDALAYKEQTAQATPNVAISNGYMEELEPKAPASEETRPLFVVDTKPTPVSLPVDSHKPTKQNSKSPKNRSPPSGIEQNSPKKSKQKHDGDPHDETRIELEDISAEVDARMKEKEKRRKYKEEKKRKRESEGDSAELATENGISGDAEEVKRKKKKKKTKKSDETAEGETEASKKRHGENDEEAANGKKKRRKRMKNKGEDSGVDED